MGRGTKLLVVFSATDIVRVINNKPDYTKAGNYWRWLKRKLKQNGVRPVSTAHGFKFEAPDGKLRVADAFDGSFADNVKIREIMLMIFK